MAPCRKDLLKIPGSWKCPRSSIAYILTRYVTHWACLGCSGSTDCVPVLANIQQLRTAIEEEWDNISQATINNLINSMWKRCVVLHEANGGPSRYWLVFGPTALPLFLRYMWPTDAYLYSQSCEIHSLGPNELISVYWFPNMNCNSVRSLIYTLYINTMKQHWHMRCRCSSSLLLLSLFVDPQIIPAELLLRGQGADWCWDQNSPSGRRQRRGWKDRDGRYRLQYTHISTTHNWQESNRGTVQCWHKISSW